MNDQLQKTLELQKLMRDPASVLALIAKNERLEAQVRLAGVAGEMAVHEAVGRAATDFGVAVMERDRLKAENEALRKALSELLDLYDTDEGCRSLPQYIAGRAALSKGEQP